MDDSRRRGSPEATGELRSALNVLVGSGAVNPVARRFAIQQTTDSYIAHDVDGCPAAVQQPVDGQKHGDIVGGQRHGLEDQGHRHQTRFWNAGRADRCDYRHRRMSVRSRRRRALNAASGAGLFRRRGSGAGSAGSSNEIGPGRRECHARPRRPRSNQSTSLTPWTDLEPLRYRLHIDYVSEIERIYLSPTNSAPR